MKELFSSFLVKGTQSEYFGKNPLKNKTSILGLTLFLG